jgi:predicted ABC-type ATPase
VIRPLNSNLSTINLKTDNKLLLKKSNNFHSNSEKNALLKNNKDYNLSFTGIKELTKTLYRNIIIQLGPLKLPLTKYDNDKVLLARVDECKAQQLLIKAFGVKSTALIQTEERKLLRVQIAQKLISNAHSVKQNEIPNLYITIGLPGSGKSSVIEKPICQKLKAIVLDKDEAKQYLPEYNKGKANYLVSDEAGEITESAFSKALSLRCNIVKPNIGTVYSDIIKYAQAAKDVGYSVHLRLIDIPPDEAAKRALKRFETNGRFTDTLIHQYLGEKPKQNYLKLMKENKGLFSSFAAYSNDVEQGQSPIFIKKLSSIKESEIKN